MLNNEKTKKTEYVTNTPDAISTPNGSGTGNGPNGINPNSKPAPTPNYGFKVMSAKDIQEATYDQTDFIVDSMVTPGLNVLGGPKKHGKSWFLLQMSLCIAEGTDFLGKKTEQGRVLYMTLEDTPKRIQRRMDKVLDDADAPGNLDFTSAVDWTGPGLSKGIEKYLTDHPDTKAVIIDVLQKIRSSKYTNQSDYDHDYEDSSSLKEIADKYGIAIITATHCRKTKDKDDWINEIMGSVGLTGAADTIIKLSKKSANEKSKIGRLRLTGRDFPESDLTLQFNQDNCTWEYIGSTDELEQKNEEDIYAASPVVKTIKQLLEQNNGKWQGTTTELLNEGNMAMGEPIAKNSSALARKINKLDKMFLKDSIRHIRPNSNGGPAGRIHCFIYEDKETEIPRQPDESAEAVSPLAVASLDETAAS